jgi:hypothetical protein
MTKITEIVIAEIGGKTEVLYTHERRPCMAERDRIEKIKQKRKKESEMLKYDSRYKEQSGQGAMEYVIACALVIIVAFILLTILAPAITEVMQEILEGLDSVALMMGVA